MSGHVVMASDKFKGSLTATEVAARIAAGLGDRARVVALPVADGGDGTVDAVVACGFTRVEVEVTGPTGERVKAAYGWRPGDGPGGEGPTAVIELAEASGLRRLSAGKAPLTATSHGTGQLIAHALRRGARRVVLGLGGSACTDGGAGMLQALGARLLDDQGRDLPPGGAALRRLARIDLSDFLSATLISPAASTSAASTSAASTSAASTPARSTQAGSTPAGATASGSASSVSAPARSAQAGTASSGSESAGSASSGSAPASAPPGSEPAASAAGPARARHPEQGIAASIAGVEFVVASDVDNPLLGPHGAAAVYGPQKGASPTDVAILEAGLTRFAQVAAQAVGVPLTDHEIPDASDDARASTPRPDPRPDETGGPRTAAAARTPQAPPPPYADRPGAGAAGGVGFAAMAFLGARLRPGIAYLLDLLRFDDHLEGARLVITGEGSLDAQSLRGKAPVGVAEAAGRRGVPVIAVCGRRSLTDEQLRAAGIRTAYALTDLEPDPAACMAHAGPLLERLAARMAATEPELRE